MNLLSGSEDPEKHFVIQRLERLNRTTFLQLVSHAVSTSKDFRKAGTCIRPRIQRNFEAAAYRTAQIVYDLQFDGAPLFYSWPSRGSIEGYEYDQQSSRQARPFLTEFLDMVRQETGAKIIHLIAHSLGNDPLMEILAQMNFQYRDGTPLFNQVILAAPDIDIDVFNQLAKKIEGVAQGITLYASADDRAIKVSKLYAGGIPRAGDVPPNGPLIVQGIDTIDITVLGDNPLSLNHSEYAEDRLLLNDIGLLLKNGLRPPRKRSPTLIELGQVGMLYWSFPR